jgi:uncharacterized tellurite resistance protein B-like protein
VRVNEDKEQKIAEEFKTAMLDAIDKFFQTHMRPLAEKSKTAVPDRRLQLATAVLLIEMTRADHEINADEQRSVTDAVERALGLSPEETAEIVNLAEKHVKRSVPFYFFTRLIDREFSLEQKKLLVEQMWRVAYSDAQLLAHEEYLVRKVSQLLHLPLADFLDAKIRARDAFR